MNKLIVLILGAVLLSGCHTTVSLRDSVDTIEKTAQHDTKRYLLRWFDTKKTCSIKLEQSDGEIIQLHNKLFTVRKQLRNLNNSLDRRSRLRKLLSGI